MLHEKECKVPSRNTWPPGASLPPTAARLQEAKASPPKDAGSLESAIPAPKKSAQEKEPEEVRIPWYLSFSSRDAHGRCFRSFLCLICTCSPSRRSAHSSTRTYSRSQISTFTFSASHPDIHRQWVHRTVLYSIGHNEKRLYCICCNRSDPLSAHFTHSRLSVESLRLEDRKGGCLDVCHHAVELSSG